MSAPLEHGHTRYGGCKRLSPTYISWMNMKRRCSNPDHHHWDHYGGRGITYDPRWEVFKNFLEDMGERPEGTTLDRIDPDGDYHKENCRWASGKQQSLNKRNTVFLLVCDELRPLDEWAEITGIPYQTLWGRIKRGWDGERAVNTPVDTKRRRKNPI